MNIRDLTDEQFLDELRRISTPIMPDIAPGDEAGLRVLAIIEGLQTINAELLAALKEATGLSEAHGWAPAQRVGWARTTTKAEQAA